MYVKTTTGWENNPVIEKQRQKLYRIYLLTFFLSFHWPKPKICFGNSSLKTTYSKNTKWNYVLSCSPIRQYFNRQFENIEKQSIVDSIVTICTERTSCSVLFVVISRVRIMTLTDILIYCKLRRLSHRPRLDTIGRVPLRISSYVSWLVLFGPKHVGHNVKRAELCRENFLILKRFIL